jgi:DNA invertase Pin-like site-specific DNA recombinase
MARLDVQSIREQIEERFAELRPLVEEEAELQRMLAAIDGQAAARLPKRTRGRPRRSRSNGRRKRISAADRKQQIRDVVASSDGGIRQAEVARALGVSQPTVGRFIPEMVKAKTIKQDRKKILTAA